MNTHYVTLVAQEGKFAIFIVGITGGIACGKSTVATLLRERGFSVIDADQIARDVVKPGEAALRAIQECFGDHVLDETGALNRQRLGSIVFSDPIARKKLETITHPEIFRRTRAQLEALRMSLPTDALVFYENALLVETGMSTICDAVIAVTATPAVQEQRLRDRNPDLSEQERIQRMASQLSTDDKAKHADFNVTNNGTHEELYDQVMNVVSTIKERDHV